MFVFFLFHVAVLSVTRRPRIPGTTSAVYRREVACGVDPTIALLRALDEFHAIRAGQVWSLSVGHDDGCAALAGGGMPDCTCELVRLEARRAA
jgi:hypothetical protein